MTDELDELEDFELAHASYEVWVSGFDRFDAPVDFELLVGSFTNPDAAVDRAKGLSVSSITKERKPPIDTEYFKVEVETIITQDLGESENVGAVYKKCIKNIKPAIDLWIHESDYELTEIGNLKVTSEAVQGLLVGDYLKVFIIGRKTDEPLPLKVLDKDTCSITCEFID